MTALKEYQRLECTGLWRDTPDAQRREVAVSFGDATLVISEARSGRALAHWSLPAVTRVNPGRMPARYAPGPDAGEELELEDKEMIAAVERVHALIEARRPHPGRLRGFILGAILLVILAVGLFWMPRALVSHTAAALPFSKRQEIGRIALADLTRLTGTPCGGSEGAEALARLSDRLFGARDRLFVLPEGLSRTRHLPGGVVLLPRALVERLETPHVAAGTILAEDARRTVSDPLIGILDHAGLRATLTLLTTGDLPADTVHGYGEVLLRADPLPVTDAALLARFTDAGVPTTPYAYTLDPSGESVLGLIEADPYRGRAAPAPILSDTEWVALQGICAE
ncbi:hypothetical protein DEA8626_00653 [Defluviimonas aquaemixtae]|uniref:Uncharacterized protein n=1 Tax=Albidovulum aquaemixtae TaxID=1542388 RepID=A0A2R8B3F9_9RHOB|nr:hypothetical protein [Defluviimonas aquaemixtae]SPH17138.1 hypothetical protein DEA8626_00653 [Defluviimonas aquaemixtae]